MNLSDLMHTAFKRFLHVFGYHGGNIAIQKSDLPHGCGGQEGVFFAGDKRDYLDVFSQSVVGQRHAKLVFEIQRTHAGRVRSHERPFPGRIQRSGCYTP